MDEKELYWVAGLLEGEGCFGIAKGKLTKQGLRHNTANLQINMNDEDVMLKLRKMFGDRGSYGGPYGVNRTDGVKSQGHFKISLNGQVAVDVMEQILSTGMMGARRTARIREVLAAHGTYSPGSVLSS